MNRLRLIVLLVAFVGTLLCLAAPARAAGPDPRDAFEGALQRLRQENTAGGAYTLTVVMTDGPWAYAIAEPDSPQRDEHGFIPFVGARPGDAWVIVAPPDGVERYNKLLAALPDALIDEATRAFLTQPVPGAAANYVGHRLPWPYGQPGVVTKRDGSGHVNQIDLVQRVPYAPGTIIATRPGTVVFVKESSSSGACDFNVWRQGNMVVVQHGPQEYTWYVHLAPNSATVNVGDPVDYGTKLGVQGATGYACGVHLHYMASSGHTTWTDPRDPNSAPWGTGITAVDFDEAVWPSLIVGQTYTSRNRGNQPCAAPSQLAPSGAIARSYAITFTWSDPGGCARTDFSFRLSTNPLVTSAIGLISQTSTAATALPLVLNRDWQQRDLYWGVRANSDAGGTWSTGVFRIEPAPRGVFTLYAGLNYSGAALASGSSISDLRGASFNDLPRSMRVDPSVGVLVCVDAQFHGVCGRATGRASFSDLDALTSGLDLSVSSVRACDVACPPAPQAITLSAPSNDAIVFDGVPLGFEWATRPGETYRLELYGGALVGTYTSDWSPSGKHTTSWALIASTQPYTWRVKASNGFGDTASATRRFYVRSASHLWLPSAAHR